MSFQKGVIVFLPILLSLVLLHHLFLTSVVSAQSENLTRRLLSIEDDEFDTEAQCPADTQTENALQTDAEIQKTQSELHTSLLLSPSQSQKNVPNDSNIEVNSDPYIPPFPPTIQMESDVSINSNPEVQRTKESASNDRVVHDEL
ncbi:hypothetical protein VIGAN_06043600 [Vigna angularis var. angularis]|uniref:Uncharacterized protein n=1 Tax=Vigna angularis var. angularis TaxID=157739 RepID=A0A0S3S9D0_PHAAN|nr:uncharacterized protein LOC128196580 isoform X2 [Vigna angularis]BAT89473.1 hypothetical protein VIGAN_06043600 [Vigna angularis var. angularis]